MSQAHPFVFVSGATGRLNVRAVFDRWAGWVDGLALLVLAGFVRAVGIGGLPFWYDELFTIFWSRLPVGFLLGAGAHKDPTPPTYYLFMHGWIWLFGDSPLALHTPSLIFSSLTVPVVYLTAKTLFDRRTALLAGLFVAINPFLVVYSQEARTYALLCLADSLALLALAVYFRFRDEGGVRLLRWLALFAAAVIFGVFLHFTSIFFLTACFLAVGLELAIGGPNGIWPVVMWGVIAAVTAACVAYPLWLAAGISESSGLAWIPPLSLPSATYFLLSVVLDPQAPMGWPGWLCCGGLAAVLAAGAWWLRLGRVQALLVVVLPALFCAMLFVASGIRPILVPRVGIFLAVPLSILLARAVLSQRWPALQWVAGGVVLAAWLVPLVLYFRAPDKENWTLAAAIAVHQQACDGPLVYVGNSGMGLIYYQPSLASRPLYSLSLTLADGRLWRVPIADAQKDMLETAYLHSQFLYLRDLPALIAAHLHTMLVLRPPFASVVEMLPRPAALGELPGRLVVACY
jgi:mannosyltransferase